MKIVAAIVFLLATYFSSLSQVITIVDETGQPVSYATVEVPKREVAVFARANGTVNLPERIAGDDTIFISSIGFSTMAVKKKDIKKTLQLTRQIQRLPEVLAYAGKWITKNLGYKGKKIKPAGCSSVLMEPGEQIGRVVYLNDGAKWTNIEKISFFYVDAGKTNAPVRLRIYELDDKEKPGNDLLQQTMVQQMSADHGWLEFDLSDNPVRMPEKGVFVAVEFFSTDSIFFHQVSAIDITDTLNKGQIKQVQQLGGGFKTIEKADEQGLTWLRKNGRWIRALDQEVPDNYKKLFYCSYNLVVKVLVRYPKD